MNKIPVYLYSKLTAKKQTNEFFDYAKAHNLDVRIVEKELIDIDPDFYNISIRRNKTKTKNVVIYARFSSSNQNEISITGQLDECFEYCKNEFYTVCAIYVDMAQTGTNERRFAFQKLNEDISLEKYNGFNIIVYKSNRFFRDRKKSAYYRCVYDAYGIDVESATQHYGKGKGAVMMRTIEEGLDEYYSVDLAEAVKRGLTQRALQCRYTGGYVTYGYKINDTTKLYEINEIEAENVKLVFEMYANKKGYTEILRELDSRGAVSRKGVPFSKNTLADMLNNEKYIGIYTFGVRTPKDDYGSRNSHKYNSPEDIVRIPGGVPAIIDKEIFEMAQKRKEANKHGTHSKREKERYLLSGLLHCGECGHAFTGNSRKAGRNKTKYVTYRCTNHNKGEKCDCKEVNRDYLENFVIDTIINRILIPQRKKELLNDFRERAGTGNSEYYNKIAFIKEDIKTLEAQRRNILNAVDKGIATEDLLEHLTDKKNEIERAKNALKDLENNPPKPIDEKEFDKLLKKTKKIIKQKNSDELRKMIAFYVSRIEIKKDDITVILSYSNVVSLVGGDGGNRNHVRKSIPETFYECSLSIVIPYGTADKQAFLSVAL